MQAGQNVEGSSGRRRRRRVQPAEEEYVIMPEPGWNFPILAGGLQCILLIFFGIFVRYGNLVKEEAVYGLFQDVHIMIFVGFGFLMTFLHRYGYSAVGFNFFLAAFVIQMSVLMMGFWHQVFTASWHNIYIDYVTLINGDFCAAAVMITLGALLGRVSSSQLIIVALCEVACYSLNEAILSDDKLGVEDFGGSMKIHMFGAFFGMAASFFLSPKNVGMPENAFDASRSSDKFAMVGSIFLWCFFPSFNAALVGGAGRQRAIINTYFGIAASCLTAFACSKILRPQRRFDMTDIQNATLAGGVAMGANAATVVWPFGAIFIGMCGAIVSVIGFAFITPALLDFANLRDTCSVQALHGYPGLVGAIASIINAGIANDALYGTDAGGTLVDVFPFRGAPYNRDAGTQAGYQVAGIVITLVIAIIGGAFTGALVGPIFGNFCLEQPATAEETFDDAKEWTNPALDL